MTAGMSHLLRETTKTRQASAHRSQRQIKETRVDRVQRTEDLDDDRDHASEERAAETCTPSASFDMYRAKSSSHALPREAPRRVDERRQVAVVRDGPKL